MRKAMELNTKGSLQALEAASETQRRAKKTSSQKIKKTEAIPASDASSGKIHTYTILAKEKVVKAKDQKKVAKAKDQAKKKVAKAKDRAKKKVAKAKDQAKKKVAKAKDQAQKKVAQVNSQAKKASIKKNTRPSKTREHKVNVARTPVSKPNPRIAAATKAQKAATEKYSQAASTPNPLTTAEVHALEEATKKHRQ